MLSHLVKAFCNRAQGEASDLAFTVELASQLCLQTTTKKRKLSDEVNGNEVETLASQVTKVLQTSKKLVSEVLAEESVETQDPFNEFMASGNNGEKMEGEDEENLESDLLPSF